MSMELLSWNCRQPTSILRASFEEINLDSVIGSIVKYSVAPYEHSLNHEDSKEDWIILVVTDKIV